MIGFPPYANQREMVCDDLEIGTIHKEIEVFTTSDNCQCLTLCLGVLLFDADEGLACVCDRLALLSEDCCKPNGTGVHVYYSFLLRTEVCVGCSLGECILDVGEGLGMAVCPFPLDIFLCKVS